MKRTLRSNGNIHLFTYREGLLSAVAHDLRLTLHRFELEYDDELLSVSGRFYPDSLSVDGAMREGQLVPGALSAKDMQDICDNIASKKVLDVAHHPEIRFDGKAPAIEPDTHRVEGTLQMVGRSADVAFTIRAEGQRLRGEVTIAPTRWGIQPFKALLGTMKIKDEVRLTFDLPAEQWQGG